MGIIFPTVYATRVGGITRNWQNLYLCERGCLTEVRPVSKRMQPMSTLQHSWTLGDENPDLFHVRI